MSDHPILPWFPDLGPSWWGLLSLKETWHEIGNSLCCFPMLFPSFQLPVLIYVSNHPHAGDLKRLHELTVLSIQHEVWNSVCSGAFGNRIVEALNPNLFTVVFYHQGSQGKPGISSLVCSWDWIVLAVTPTALSLLPSHLISLLRFMERGERLPLLPLFSLTALLQ